MPSPIIPITLSEPLDAFIRDCIAAGRAATASQVVDAIRRDIEVGFNQAERGDLVDGPAVFDGLLSRRRGRSARPESLAALLGGAKILL